MKATLYVISLALIMLLTGCSNPAVPDGSFVSGEFMTGDGSYNIIHVSRRDKYHMLAVLRTQPGVMLFTHVTGTGDKIAIYTDATDKVELKNKHGIYIFDDTNGPVVYFYEKKITPGQYAEFKEKCGSKKDFVLEDLIRYFEINQKPVIYYGK